MQIDLTPTLIDIYRETFEGEVKPGWVWIISGPAESAVLGSLSSVTWEQAYKSPAPGRKSIASHAAHLKYTLELTHRRLHGENPAPDWPGSFEAGEHGEANWKELQEQLRTAYDAVLQFFDAKRDEPVSAWEPIQVAGLAAMIGHNAYHLGAIRQLMLEVRG